MRRAPGFALFIPAFALSAQLAGAAQITFYEGEGFRGRAFTTERQVENFRNYGFNDRASSVVVDSGNWIVCEDSRYSGRCVLLRRGAYDSLRRMGVNNRVSSVRPMQGRRHDRGYVEAPQPLPEPTYAYRRRANEEVYEVPVTSVRAVVGPPDHRCWVEREQVEDRGGPNVGGAVVGAIIGGIIGHQIGGGRGKDIATAGGAVAGGVIGSRVGQDRNDSDTRDVRRCETRVSGPPDYYDVTYDYRGVEHSVQMSAPPQGRTLFVNRDGEPRQ